MKKNSLFDGWLSPGDKAPALQISNIFNDDEDVRSVEFDRLSTIILWNAGCAGCLPVVNEIAEFGRKFAVPVYGVAVMVSDVERTREAASTSTDTILVIEERSADLKGLMRGSVTRNWMEASGQLSVPLGFLVDENQRILWIGDPREIRDILPAILDDTWSVTTAREKWRLGASNDVVIKGRLLRELTDALLSKEFAQAHDIVACCDQQIPSIANDPEFAILKFSVLASDRECRDSAVAYYDDTMLHFAQNLRVQSVLANTVLKELGEWPQALNAALVALEKIDESLLVDEIQIVQHLYCRLLSAEILVKLGKTDRALSHVQSVKNSLTCQTYPAKFKSWLLSEANRVSNYFTDG